MSIATTLRINLMAVANAYAAARGIELTTLGGLMRRGNTNYFPNLAAGRVRMIAETYDECMVWFSTNWPKGTKWPTGIRRPRAKELSHG